MQLQLERYISSARTYGIKFKLENDLYNEKWAWCYPDSGLFPWTQDAYCAWAGAPGEVYFKKLDDLSSSLRSSVWKRYQAQRGLLAWNLIPVIPVWDPVLAVPVA